MSDSIIFYCKDCEEVVQTNKVGGKYVYTCKKCGTKNVAFGTVKSITNFFHLEEKKKEEEKAALAAKSKAEAQKKVAEQEKEPEPADEII